MPLFAHRSIFFFLFAYFLFSVSLFSVSLLFFQNVLRLAYESGCEGGVMKQRTTWTVRKLSEFERGWERRGWFSRVESKLRKKRESQEGGAKSLSLSLYLNLSPTFFQSCFIPCWAWYPSVPLSIHPPICLSICLLICLSIHESICVCLLVHPFICPTVHPSVCLSIHLSNCLYLHLYDHPSVHPSILIVF